MRLLGALLLLGACVGVAAVEVADWPNFDRLLDTDTRLQAARERLELLGRDATQVQKVLVLSHVNVPNFGDRLGFHVLNSVLPADCLVHHVAFEDCEAGMCPPALPELQEYDMLVLGTGASLFSRTITPELMALVEAVPLVVGIFGTQYHSLLAAGQVEALVDSVDLWFARYRDDVARFGGKGLSQDKVLYLGDWLVDMCPMGQWRKNDIFVVGADLQEHEVPLDRVVQQIQEARYVNSSRLHPLLCALPSAEKVAFVDQREMASGRSGKFMAMLQDVFGPTFTAQENTFFTVDKAAVAAYKVAVRSKMDAVRSLLGLWLHELRAPTGGTVMEHVTPWRLVPPLRKPWVEARWLTWLQFKEAAEEYNAGVAALRDERLKEAKHRFTAALDIKPDLAEAHLQLGILLGQIGRTEDSLKHVQQAVGLGHPGVYATGVLADFLGQMEKPKKAAKALKVSEMLRERGALSSLESSRAVPRPAAARGGGGADLREARELRAGGRLDEALVLLLRLSAAGADVGEELEAVLEDLQT